jgi:hypothetical protein
MNIVTKIKSYKIKEINQLLNKMLSSNNLDKRMDYCDELLSELEMNDIDISEIEDDIKDLAIG